MSTIDPRLANKMFIAGTIMMIVAVALSAFNAAAVLSAPLRANVTVPATVGFEGFLSGVTDGQYSLTFRIYNDPTAGTIKWDQTINPVQVTNGLYSVALGGSPDPFLSDTFNGDRWISVQVGTGTEITPRTQISSVPFALNADNSNKIGGGTVINGTTSMIGLFDGPCPLGWTEFTAAQGRYVVGVPAGGALGVTVGTALGDQEIRAVGQHTHTISDPGHSHTFSIYNGNMNPMSVPLGGTNNGPMSVSTGTATTGITINNAGSVIGTNAPYIQLRYCKLNPT